MIYFITNTTHYIEEVAQELEIINEAQGLSLFQNLLVEETLGLDSENTGLDPYTSFPLLYAIGTKNIQFILDATSINVKEFIDRANSHVTWIGHNLKYDYSFVKVHFKTELQRIYDTMITEQRLYPNLFPLSSKPFALNHVILRNFGYIPPEMNKDIRAEFPKFSPTKDKFYTRHITYAAGDIAHLFKLKEIQERAINKYNMRFLLEEIEFPLVCILAEMELEGLDIDEKSLLELIEKNKKIRREKQIALDSEFRKLRDTYADEKNKKFIKSGIYDSIRTNNLPTTSNVPTLFGDMVDASEINYSKRSTKTKKSKTKEHGINYSSSIELIRILGRLRFTVPTKEGKYIVPLVNDKNKIINDYEGFTTNEKDFEQYLISNPTTPIRRFIELLLEYREVTTELNKYGKDFLKKKNPITKRIHTQYRQCDAVNGRFQSGGRKEQPDKINIQNVPRKKEFRQLFYREGYDIITIDLAGAEVTIMADKANDTKLFELAMKGDIHSHMATRGWRNILKSRRDINADIYTVSKTENKEKRVTAKNLTFGSIYGCGAKRAGKTINVSPAEGQIYIDTIKREVPLTFKMVERNVVSAFRQGYLILNTRTNSRIWFPQVIDAYKNKRELEFREQHEIDGQARNVPISGTQADIVKEAMIVITNYFKENNLDCAIILQVHDEIAIRTPKHYGIAFNISLGDKIKELLCTTANKYLTNIKMDASLEISSTWTK